MWENTRQDSTMDRNWRTVIMSAKRSAPYCWMVKKMKSCAAVERRERASMRPRQSGWRLTKYRAAGSCPVATSITSEIPADHAVTQSSWLQLCMVYVENRRSWDEEASPSNSRKAASSTEPYTAHCELAKGNRPGSDDERP